MYLTQEKGLKRIDTPENSQIRVFRSKKSADTFIYGLLSTNFRDSAGRRIPFMFGINSSDSKEIMQFFKTALKHYSKEIEPSDESIVEESLNRRESKKKIILLILIVVIAITLILLIK